MKGRLPLLPGLALLAVALTAMPGRIQAAPATDAPGPDLPYPSAHEPQPDEIVHVPTGLPMSFGGMMDMVAGARLVCIGESHDNLQAHRVQLQIIRDLHRRFPGRIAIGMEMFRQPQQEILDRWTQGGLSELEFVQAADWLGTWNTDFGYYRDILDFARVQRIDLIALNPSRELQDAVRRLGLENLPEDLRRQLPELGAPDPYQQALIKAVYGAHLPTEGAFDSFLRVQLLWEESMAERVVDYLKSARGSGKIVVTLTGTGHVEYGFGVPKKVLRRMPLPYVVIVPTEIEIPPEKQMPGMEQPEIPLLPSDFVWWVPYETLDASTMRLGVGVGVDVNTGVVVVRSVAEHSPAERAGILVGDEILAFAGHPVAEVNSLLYWIGKQTAGSAAVVTVRRARARLDIKVGF